MKIVECVQYSPSWWEARRGIPTASQFDRIITPGGKPSKGMDRYIAELVGERVDLRPNWFTERPMNPAMRHGLDTEPEARRFYEYERGLDAQLVGFCQTDDGRFGCSPDALVGDDGGLELKCVQLPTQVEYLLAGTLPDEYRPQVHGQLIVTGRKWFDFMSYAPPLPPLLVRVVPDDYTRQLRIALEVFHEKYAETLKRLGVCPARSEGDL